MEKFKKFKKLIVPILLLFIDIVVLSAIFEVQQFCYAEGTVVFEGNKEFSVFLFSVIAVGIGIHICDNVYRIFNFDVGD